MIRLPLPWAWHAFTTGRDYAGSLVGALLQLWAWRREGCDCGRLYFEFDEDFYLAHFERLPCEEENYMLGWGDYPG